MKHKNILITCGPTWIPLDTMRVISNQSSGQLGQLLAKTLKSKTVNVTLLEGQVEIPIRSKSIKVIKFSYYEEFKQLFKQELKKKYDCVIHAAAVSDYKLNKIYKNKISSGLKKLHLELVPTEKLIQTVKKIRPDITLVGFKLESNINKSNMHELTNDLFSQSGCDYVVANTLKNNKYKGYITKSHEILAECNSREHLVKALVKILR